MKNSPIVTILFTLSLLVDIQVLAQKELLQSGPMVGYSEMREVMLWVQTKQSVDVKFSYWDVEHPDEKLYTHSVVSSQESAFATHIVADKVLPGKKYKYELYLNDERVEFDYPLEFKTQKLWQWREDAPDFTFVVGSCNYVNDAPYDRPKKPYGGDYQIFKSIYHSKPKPEMMLWLGDNTYYREADWNTKTGIYYRNTHTRSLKDLQPLLSNTHHYAILDDHDFGPNDAVGSFAHKNLTIQAFKDFWANPNYGVDGGEGITGQFSYHDCDFFLLDNRSFRTPQYKNAKGYILGKNQVEWLISSLKSSRASFKFVAQGGQFLNPIKVYENHSNYEEERAYILKRIEEEEIENVVFLSGDRHHSEINRLKLNDNLVIYDITSSPLTSRAHKKMKEENVLRVDGSAIKERNFTQIKVMGSKNKRQLHIVYRDVNGKPLFQYTIYQKERR